MEPHLERRTGVAPAEFDRFSDSYEADLNRVLSWAGQDADVYTSVKVEALLDLASRHLGDPARQRFLDVGCGTGATERHLVGRVGAVHGVDISDAMIQRARAEAPGVAYKSYDGSRLPFDDASMDVSFSICVAHHVPPSSWPSFFAEMARVTRCGGLVVIAEHNPYNPVTRAIVSRCAFDRDVVLLSQRTTRRLLVAARLHHLETRNILFMPWRTHFVARIEALARRLPLGAQYLVAGRRAC